eukprot:5503554-Pyramimonas_sp.AAC.1
MRWPAPSVLLPWFSSSRTAAIESTTHEAAFITIGVQAALPAAKEALASSPFRVGHRLRGQPRETWSPLG